MARKRAFLSGAKAFSPIILGVIPFGLIYGISASEAGLDPIESIAMSLFFFAGASQMVAVQLISQNTPAIIVIATAVIVNLRFVIYSASLAPYFQGLSRSWRSLLSYLTTDEPYALSITHYTKNPEAQYKHWYFFGAGLTLWATWQICSIAGIFAGPIIPAGLQLDFAIPLVFIALLVTSIGDKMSLGAALAAGIIAVAAFGLPYNLGLVAGAIGGVVFGIIFGREE
ncbi:branched-chain amino acid ABC transporter permease [Methanocella sp. CWC-04]|uniref:Branched-chain amino acid ABC transporter permease n=1 Tax=Methanooceanicella nereidis TaxID=2052831 RepID=A0AAP2RB40_9EURY|nr:AzlC family ABC transporter permease [Methanocella sp. CWC-04]MCD1293646.1 branched-chain amino acid ABC transporter permease [Methanocella sp. CWC-04]